MNPFESAAATQRRPPRTRAVILLSTILLLNGVAFSAETRTTPGEFDRAGLDGTATAVMQPVDVGHFAFLVASIPGRGGEAWAAGRTTAAVPGWAGTAGGGQVIMLRYTRAQGWRSMGPPLDSAGRAASPSLTAIAVAATGEGWAVGDGGTMLHLRPGEQTWRVATSPTQAALRSVSLISSRGAVSGFAAGDRGTLLRLNGGTWTAEQVAGTLATTDFASVAASSVSDAYAVGQVAGGLGDRSLVVARRIDGTWQQLQTGVPLFDGPHPVVVNQTGYRASYGTAVSATRRGAWIAGTILPVEAGSSLGDPAGDSSRPFVLFYDASSRTFRSWCPDRYTVGSGGAAVTVVCDGPFPMAAFDITAIQAFAGARSDEVFAGGLGLFHFTGEWVREPDSIGYLSSLSLATPREGWAAVAGGGIGAGGGGFGTSTVLGHWTAKPETPRTARWSQPNDLLLEAVAIAPDDSGRAIAVGLYGATVAYRPLEGWEADLKVTALNLHAVAWPSAERAWAVGQRGTIQTYNGRRWMPEPSPTDASLFGVAFSSPSRGYAVGGEGEILRFDGTRWRRDHASGVVTTNTLYGIAAAGDRFVAVGDEGTVLVNENGTWRGLNLSSLLTRAGRLPSLYAVAATPAGEFVAGGELSTLIRMRGETWSIDRDGARVPPEGTVVAIGASRDGLLVSLAEEDVKFQSDQPGIAAARLLAGDAGGWHDVAYSTRATIYATYDSAAPRDPVYGITFDARGGAWAAGGTPPLVDDGRGHRRATPSSSVYRYLPSGDPSQPAQTTEPVLDPSGFSFAFFGESACGKALCGATTGSGAMADVVALQIRDEVNRMSQLPGGPRFVIFGGNMRRSGIPEEIGQFKRYLEGFRIPVFAALGDDDLFAGLTAGSDQDVQPSNAFWLRTFADRARPWGHSAPFKDLLPVTTATCTAPRAGQAATHYVFDYAPGGVRQARFIVLDDSTGSLSSTESQNPVEDQQVCMKGAVQEADLIYKIPSIIAMNRPTQDPLAPVPQTTTIADAAQFTTNVTGTGVSAVVAAYYKENAVYFLPADRVPGAIPVYVSGGGGSPLEGNREPNSGFYHSWMLLHVDTDAAPSITGQKPVSAKVVPVTESLSMHALDGVHVKAGSTLRFTGLGRTPDGGGPDDPSQANATYVPIPMSGLCRPLCSLSGRLAPDYRFISENPRVGVFVQPSTADPTIPYLDERGELVPDETSGLFCGIGAGRTFVSLTSGFRRVRTLVTVDGGFGPCVKRSIPPLPEPPREPQPAPGAPVDEQEPGFRRAFFRSDRRAQGVPILPPPPISVAAPAPPGAPGIGRKEEHEVQHQESGQKKFTALSTARSRQDAETGAWLALGAAILMAIAGATVAARTVQKPDFARARERS